jgi:hypothetical protein
MDYRLCCLETPGFGNWLLIDSNIGRVEIYKEVVQLLKQLMDQEDQYDQQNR